MTNIDTEAMRGHTLSMRLDDAIRAAIEKSGRSSRSIAIQAGLDAAQVARFKRGERGLTVTSAAAVLAALGLDVQLIRRRGKKGN